MAVSRCSVTVIVPPMPVTIVTAVPVRIPVGAAAVAIPALLAAAVVVAPAVPAAPRVGGGGGRPEGEDRSDKRCGKSPVLGVHVTSPWGT